MATNGSGPFWGGTGQTGGTNPPSGSSRRLAVDNLMRRELKVSDPNDPIQVAQALLARYQSDPRARAILQEAQGLPFPLSAAAPTAVVQAPTSSTAEWDQAVSDINRDLQELTTNALLKDVSPELQGWAQAVRSTVTEGVNAARFALDPRQRDKAFGMRRQLGDYARMARLVGALTPAVNVNYRKFAQSLDEAAAVLLVMMGEALSNVGFAGGRFLLQAPYTELQVRRDAAIYALRNLVGATQDAYGPNDWPRGLDAYRRLFDALETQGQGDLRALLGENELARTMDELIQRAGHGTADGLRALGSTAQLDMDRFRRLVIVGQRTVSPESPPLTAFLEALALFADAFDTSGGFRLMRIARPPILFYGLYGASGLDPAEQVLLDLVIARGRLADLLDCFMACACTDQTITCQIIMDKILYDVDRAIDLYAVGKDPFGQPERRAAAYSYVIDYFLTVYNQPDPTVPGSKAPCALVSLQPGRTLEVTLRDILRKLRSTFDPMSSEIKTVQGDLVSFGSALRKRLTDLSLCKDTAGHDLCADIGDPVPLPTTLRGITLLFTQLQQAQERLRQHNDQKIPPQPASINAFLGILQQELCIQRDMEGRWQNLVQTMAPDCAAFVSVANTIVQVVDGALHMVGGAKCAPFDPRIPPHFETSLDGLVENVLPSGANRRDL